MEAKIDTKFGVARAFVFFSILFLFMGAAAQGQGLYTMYTRTDQLPCGGAKVQVLTTCTEKSEEIDYGDCIEQRFLFVNERTGAVVRVKSSGHPVPDHVNGKRIGVWLDALAGDWACIQGKAGSYAVVRYRFGGMSSFEGHAWYEVFDENGRELASDKEIEWDEKDAKTHRIIAGFERTWHLLGLPDPWPFDSFTSIEIFKEDRR